MVHKDSVGYVKSETFFNLLEFWKALRMRQKLTAKLAASRGPMPSLLSAASILNSEERFLLFLPLLLLYHSERNLFYEGLYTLECV